MTKDQTSYNRLFTYSGCLKLETFQLYGTSSLSGQEIVVIEKHLKECAFCSEALEGLKLVEKPEKLSFVIQKINKDLNNNFAVRNVSSKPKARVLSARILYFSAAASVLILVGVFAYLKFNKPRMQQQITAVMNEEFTNRIPPTPLPIVAKEKGSEEKDNTKQLNNDSNNRKTETVTSESEKSEIDNQPAKGFHSSEQMKHGTNVLPDSAETVLMKIEREIKRSEELIELAAIDIASTQPVEYYLGEVIIHAEKVISKQSSKMTYNPAENVTEGVAAKSEKNQRNFFSSSSKNESKGNAKELISGHHQQNNNQKPEHFFNAVDSMPEFPGGNQAMLDFLKKNLHYPAFALENHIQGTLNISFIIEETGKISAINILRGIGGGCDEEAIRVVRSMPDWSPGYDNGNPVRVRFSMPITFKLN